MVTVTVVILCGCRYFLTSEKIWLSGQKNRIASAEAIRFLFIGLIPYGLLTHITLYIVVV